MDCINFNEFYRDFLLPDEENHLKKCTICRLQWQQHMAIINQPLEEILDEVRCSEEKARSGIDRIMAIMSRILPRTSPLAKLGKIAEKAASLLPQASPEWIADAVVRFDKKELGSLSEDDFLQQLKQEFDTGDKDDNRK